VVLDLKSDAGRDAAIGLMRQCDVIVENWRPGVADRLGVGYTGAARLNPKIVYCSISGFGQNGPSATRPAYAPIIHAASGFDLAQVEYQGGGRPANTATYIADVFGGMSAYAAIQTALFHRESTGIGQFIDVALLDCMLNILVSEFQEAQSPSGEKKRVYPPLKSMDGYVVVAPTSQKNFEQLAKTVAHEEWLNDPRFTSTRAREANWQKLMDLIEGWTCERSGSEIERLLQGGGVPCTRYKTVSEAIADPQMQARGALSKVRDEAGEYWVPNAPFRMPGLNTGGRTHVPTLGENNLEVLCKLLGYSPEQAIACSRQRAAA
jgi:CoA:oxalate CoA-transferase